MKIYAISRLLKGRRRAATSVHVIALTAASFAAVGTVLGSPALAQDENFQGSPATNGVYPENATATFPLIFCWYKGQVVYYIRIDSSDQGTAEQQGLNYSAALGNSVNEQPASYDDIYTFTNAKQYNVVPSAPTPVGYKSNDPNYSPIWRVSTVAWNVGARPRTLKSEDEILKAKADGEVTVTKTTVLINCPIFTPEGGKLPNVKISLGGRNREGDDRR